MPQRSYREHKTTREKTAEDRATHSTIKKSPFRAEEIPDGAQVEDNIVGDYMARACQQLWLKAVLRLGGNKTKKPKTKQKNLLAWPFILIYHKELFIYSYFILPKRVCVYVSAREMRWM